MKQMVIRNIPDDVAARLEAKAKAAKQSVEQTAREALAAYVKPSTEEVLAELDRIRESTKGNSLDVVAMIREDRDSR